ncbi:MAG: MgtC/SapB family protein [Balneolaceae bacterium]|nr:MgtC/SapB family protein [Balneolaceae bacterium]
MEYKLLLRMGLILLLGFLVGIERGWSFQKKKEGKRTAGIRTFTLIALSGGMWGILSEHFGEMLLGIALVGFIVIIMVGYYQHARETGAFGLTTEIAAFLTFTVSVAVIKGYIVLSVSVTILMVLILSVKPKLHKWVKTIEPGELYSGILFLIISAIVLPLLPNRGYGPWDALNPYKIWLMVVLIAGISYAGYYSMKYLGGKRGLLFTSFTGSLVSSLAVTVTLARYSREVKSTNMLITGVLIATSTALGRVLLLTVIFNPLLLRHIGIPVLLMVVAAFLFSIQTWKNTEKGRSGSKFHLRNPLQLSTAVQFGMVLAVIMLLAEAGREWFGDAGIYGLSVLSGMADIDSITLSMLDMGGDHLSAIVAGRGIVLATIANTMVKGAIFTFFIGFREAWKLLLYCGLIAAAAIPGLWIQ